MALGSTLATESHRAARTVPARLTLASGRKSANTRRLSQVRQLIGEGCTNKQIAERLGISVGTAKVYVYDLFKLTGLTRTAIVVEFQMQKARQVAMSMELERLISPGAEGNPKMGAFE